MDSNELLIEKKVRAQLSRGVKWYRITIGFVFLLLGVILVIRKIYSVQSEISMFGEILILMGLINLVFGWMGSEIFKQKYRLRMDQETVRIKKSFEGETLIRLNKISYIKTLPLKLEITLNDYIRSFDFSELTQDEFDTFMARITAYCNKNGIEME